MSGRPHTYPHIRMSQRISALSANIDFAARARVLSAHTRQAARPAKPGAGQTHAAGREGDPRQPTNGRALSLSLEKQTTKTQDKWVMVVETIISDPTTDAKRSNSRFEVRETTTVPRRTIVSPCLHDARVRAPPPQSPAPASLCSRDGDGDAARQQWRHHRGAARSGECPPWPHRQHQDAPAPAFNQEETDHYVPEPRSGLGVGLERWSWSAVPHGGRR